MPITDRVTLFGYSASETEKTVEKLKDDFENKKLELEKSIAELQKQIEDIKQQIEFEKNNKTVVVKKRSIESENSDNKEQTEIMKALYDAHIKATEKVIKAQKDISVPLEKRKLLILMRERKASEMKNDLQNLIDYVDSIAKSY